MRKILTVLGARPQFIKASVVSHGFRQSGQFQEVLVHTGQHFDANMSDVFFDELGMSKPDHFLDIHGGGHGAMTGRMLERLEQVMQAERPDAVLVYGDTNSTLAGALAAAKLHIPVAHIEAGLRSFNMAMPEEVNRILTDRVSRWLFTPTNASTQHLVREGVAPSAIEEVGDVMYDVALHHGQRVDATGRVLQQLNLAPGAYVLATVHRAENTDHSARLRAIVDGLEVLAQKLPVVWPMHPRTRGVLQSMGRLAMLSPQLRLLDPVGYLDMVQLEKHAAVIATDSGGVQKEAFFYRVPCVTLRDETEWVELVNAGWNRLVPPVSSAAVANAVISAIGSKGQAIEPYGKGDAAIKIVNALKD
ncbi:non-hydrolyzing UDP-N-acetylglucosamine 2-epimerase [Limnohabitans sp. 2KL-3]|uniref:non-hydrolyzing UDP-N-acetylglucosamine 2-epimerase n=1 Tax=Limnohabitans sp. 2KL-3 TaxID=1100700 RepID=UPI000A40CCCE|nr:UDP-N-acetylglucosamine 2-epimerase (non-hydrolyzing) [Limnohabitans sp. 2KL-3]